MEQLKKFSSVWPWTTCSCHFRPRCRKQRGKQEPATLPSSSLRTQPKSRCLSKPNGLATDKCPCFFWALLPFATVLPRMQYFHPLNSKWTQNVNSHICGFFSSCSSFFSKPILSSSLRWRIQISRFSPQQSCFSAKTGFRLLLKWWHM